MNALGCAPSVLTQHLLIANLRYSDVENELQSLFEAQYHLNTEGRTETVTETRNVRVGESLGQVVTSGYCNCRICCGVWSGGPTASGAYPTANHTIAVDASNPFVPIGTKVVMNGVEYTVEDTGAFARYGVQFFDSCHLYTAFQFCRIESSGICLMSQLVQIVRHTA